MFFGFPVNQDDQDDNDDYDDQDDQDNQDNQDYQDYQDNQVRLAHLCVTFELFSLVHDDLQPVNWIRQFWMLILPQDSPATQFMKTRYFFHISQMVHKRLTRGCFYKIYVDLPNFVPQQAVKG